MKRQNKFKVDPVQDDAVIEVSFSEHVKSDGIELPEKALFSIWFSCNEPMADGCDCVIGYEWLLENQEPFGGELDCDGSNIVNVTDALEDVLDLALDNDGIQFVSSVAIAHMEE